MTFPRRIPIDDTRDPLRANTVFTVLWFLLALWRLGIPSKPMFDEIHYLPAVRHLLALSSPFNPEHPMFAKVMMAGGFALFGDNAFGWRFANACLGALGLFAATRALWWAGRSARASLLFGWLLGTNMVWFMLARIAMLDMTMAAMLALAFWQWALAWSGPEPRRGRLHLALTGVFLGLSLGAKWNGMPLLVLPGLFFAGLRWRALGREQRAEWLTARDGGPVPGVSLLEAALWLGSVPLLVYFATFIPAMFYHERPLTPGGLLEFQRTMLQLQDSVVKPHRYMSRWWQWVLDLRPIWFFYEPWDGAQRGVLMIGNPFTMLAMLPALVVCAWQGLRGGGRAGLKRTLALCYLAAVGFWAANGKPVQFYYHYALAACFGAAALALVLAERWNAGKPRLMQVSAGAAGAMFAYFYPIIAALPLAERASYLWWMWLDSWR